MPIVELGVNEGIEKALDALLNNRLALLCGAGLSMSAPSLLPSAAAIAAKAKAKYDETYGADRPPLPETIDEQAEFFFGRGELASVYLRSYIDPDAFSKPPNAGHFAIADLLLIGGIVTGVSTNVDTLVETAGNMLFGKVGAGVDRATLVQLPPGRSPFLKIHGCWSNPGETVWAAGQVDADPIKTRLEQRAQWLTPRLLNCDLVIVGFWSDWEYLNSVLELSLGTVMPSKVIVVDPCETAALVTKAPALYAIGERSNEFCHVRTFGDRFLERLRVDFSRTFVRRTLGKSRTAYHDLVGADPDPLWLEPTSMDAETLWRIRRDLEGCNPNAPARLLEPLEESLLGLTILQMRSHGAVADGCYWNLGGQRIRVLRAANKALQEVEALFSREVAPAIAPDITIAVGAESMALPASVARGSAGGSIARGPAGRWLSRTQAATELGL
jgi:hypothetical protein